MFPIFEQMFDPPKHKHIHIPASSWLFSEKQSGEISHFHCRILDLTAYLHHPVLSCCRWHFMSYLTAKSNKLTCSIHGTLLRSWEEVRAGLRSEFGFKLKSTPFITSSILTSCSRWPAKRRQQSQDQCEPQTATHGAGSVARTLAGARKTRRNVVEEAKLGRPPDTPQHNEGIHPKIRSCLTLGRQKCYPSARSEWASGS